MPVLSELITRCPVCGWKMVPWVQDSTFLQGEARKTAYRRYENFVRKNQDKKLLLLELGVGDMTPSVIKLPFWNMADKFPETFLVTVNLAKESSPEQLKGRSLAVCEDIYPSFCMNLRRICNEKNVDRGWRFPCSIFQRDLHSTSDSE